MTGQWVDGRAFLGLSDAEFRMLFLSATGGGDFGRDCDQADCAQCNVLDMLHWLNSTEARELNQQQS